MKTIVVGYDATDASRRALDRASTLAAALGAKLTVVSVAEPIPITGDPGYPGSEMGLAGPAVIPPDTAEAKRELDDAKTSLSDKGLDVEYVSTIGDAADAIVDEAQTRDADLIVVGTRHPGFLDRLFGGDVGEAVSRRSDRDVLIVH